MQRNYEWEEEESDKEGEKEMIRKHREEKE